MQTTVKDWRIGTENITTTMDDLDRAFRMARVIKEAEVKHANLIHYSQSVFCEATDYLKEKTLAEAEITRRAHQRLVKQFNILVNEIQL